MNPSSRPSARAYFLRGLLVVVTAAVLASILHKLGVLDRLELLNFDTWLLSKQELKASDIVLVTIEQPDYDKVFKASSPLNAQKVIDIINSIAVSNPKIIGVDLDTSLWTETEFGKIHANVPIVWAREAELQRVEVNSVPDGIPPRSEPVEKYTLREVAHIDLTLFCWGLTAIAPDDDGEVRSYYRRIPMFPSQVDKPDLTYPSFARELAHEHLPPDKRAKSDCDEQQERANVEELRHRINFFTGRIPRLSARAVQGIAGTDTLTGKIVLLGGAFSQARDRYATPLGMMDGVEILGHAVLTEKHGGILEAGPKVAAFVDVLVGLLLITLNYFLITRLHGSAKLWMLPIEFVLLPVLSVLLSLAAFLSFSYYSSFFLVLLGVFTHQLVEHVLEYRTLLREHPNANESAA
jgi:CHASE2 domain-containing sensor protein